MSSGPSTSSSSDDKTVTLSSTFRFDGLSKLRGQSNYVRWANEWKLSLDAADWWEVVSGEETKPTEEKKLKEWKQINKCAHATLLLATIDSLRPIVSGATDAAAAWQALKNKFDKENPMATSTILHNALYSKMAEGADINEYLTQFHNNWNRLEQRCAGKTDEFTKILGQLATNAEAKGTFLLFGLPKSMFNIVDNLQTKGELTYDDICDKLQNMRSHDIEDPDLGDNKAFFTDKGKGQSNNTKECTWCKSRKEKYLGHTYNECNKLKAHQAQRKAKKGKREESASTITHDAATTILMVRAQTPSPKNPAWILDSGATSHITPHAEQLYDIEPHHSVVRTADGRAHSATGMGKSTFQSRLPDGRVHTIVLTDVLLVPTLGSQALISETVLDQKGLRSESGNGRKFFRNKENEIVIGAKLENGHWNVQIVENTVRVTYYSDWHNALGHPATVNPNLYSDNPSIPRKPNNFHCRTCALSKSTHKVPKAAGIRATKPFEMIHSDLSGKMPVQSLGKTYYYISFIDDFTRYSYIYFLKEKSDALKAIKEFVTKVEKQHDAKVKKFRNDNGGEYVNKEARKYFLEKGIVVETIPPYSHESNGVAERFNRTVTNMVRCMIMDHGRFLWGEAYATAVYLKNRLPHSALTGDKTPYEALFGKKPTIQHLCPFGQTCYVHIPVETRPPGTKLAPRAAEGMVVGYTDSDKIIRVWIPSQHKVVTPRHVTYPPPESGEVSVEFEERNVPEETDEEEEEQPTPESEIRPESEEVDSKEEEEIRQPPGTFPETPEKKKQLPPVQAPPAPRRSTRSRKPAVRQTQLDQESESKNRTISGIERKLATLNLEFEEELEVLKELDPAERQIEEEFGWEEFQKARGKLEDELKEASAMSITHVHPLDHFVRLVMEEPNTHKQAMNGKDSEKWERAIHAEMDALKRNHTWDVVERPTNRAVVSGKWVFKIKHLADGTVDKYKARYVARGFTQVPGQDFDETFAPVVRYDSQRLLLALSAHHKWVPQQLDVKSAFLYGVLKEEIYMELPDGFKEGTKVCKLRKCIYGLKQSPREWYACLTDSLLEQGFKPSQLDPCVFIQPKTHMYLAIYVDDIMIYGPDTQFRKQIIKLLNTNFECTNLGDAKSILGIELNVRKDGSITLGQRGYTDKILERFGMTESKPVSSPLEPNSSLRKGEVEDELPDKTNYQCMIGCLMYASIGTRPDLTHAVTFLSQFNSCPTEAHLKAVKRVFRYLNGTKDYKLHFPAGQKLDLNGYSDSSYASNIDDRKFFTGYIIQLGGSAISWRSRKQRSTAVSTTEAEYMALSLTTRQLVWLKNALKELHQKCQYYIHADNTGAIELARNPRIHDRSKHIDVHYHYTREQLELGTFNLLYVPTENNLADILTKGLPKPAHEKMTREIRCHK